MRGSDLKILADVADLSKLDLDPRSGRVRLSTTYKPGALAAQYIGVSAGGCAWVMADSLVSEMEIDVEAQRFSQIVGLFDPKEDVTLKPRGKSGLIVSGKRDKALLETYETEGFTDIEDDIESSIVVDAGLLSRELDLAAAFTAKSLVRPVLNGVRMEVAKDEVRLIAYNGFSTAFAGRVKGEVATGKGVFIATVKEAIPCLKLFKSGSVSIVLYEDAKVVFRGGDAWARIPVYFDADWPNLTGLLKKYERQNVSISGAALKALATGVKIFSAPPYVSISGDDDGLVLKSTQTEYGQYVGTIEGELTGEFWYDVEDLERAAGIGDELTLEIAPGTGPTVVRGKDRRVWLAPRPR